jgi:cytochrome b6-f complex iron-sulfur subunit
MDLDPPRGDRRRFLSWFLGGSASALLAYIVYPVLRFVSPPPTPEASTHQVEVGLTNDPELQEKGYKIVRFGEEPVILIRVSSDDLRAFSATCTHLDCIVEYQKDARRIWCNCHSGQYDLMGRVVAGPPPRPLERLRVDLVAREATGPRTILVSRA